MAPGQHKCTFDLKYLNEGAANIVFRITNLHLLEEPTASTSVIHLITLNLQPTAQYLERKIIRLRKAMSRLTRLKQMLGIGKPSSGPWKSHRRVITVSLILVFVMFMMSFDITAMLYYQISEREEIRAGMVCMSEPFAMIVEDASVTGDHYVQMELKPKWLAPSPSAPNDATCCRTCALNNMRFQAGDSREREQFRSRVCPLGHLVGTHEFRRNLIDSYELTDIKDQQLETWLKELRTQIWFQSLRKAQITHDALGPSSDDAHLTSLDFRIAMTLRDCSLILKIPKHTSSDMLVRSAMIDLDLKPASAKKRAQWRETERKLVDEGWYRSSGVELAKRGIRCYLEEYKVAVARGQIG